MKIEFEGSWEGIRRQIETMLGIRQEGQEVTAAGGRLVGERINTLALMLALHSNESPRALAFWAALDNIRRAPDSDDGDTLVRASCVRAVRSLVEADKCGA